MIDIKDIRAQPETFIRAAELKQIDVDIRALLEVDGRLVELRKQLQDARTEQNAAGKRIAKLSGDEKDKAIAGITECKQRIKRLEEQIDRLQPEFDEQMVRVPQPPAPEVPVGDDESANRELRREGRVREFPFPPKDHVELGEALGIIDIPRGVKLAGARNYVLTGAGAMLHQAVLRLALDRMIERGFTPVTVPVLVSEKTMYGTGFFPLYRDQAYVAERDGMSLAGTAEVPVTSLHAEEILGEDELPKRYVAISSCFRREAGAAGKDTHGLYRVHYFDKVEQVIVGPADENQSVAFLQEILHNTEGVLQELELPYRVVACCTGELSQGTVERLDIETWMPSRGAYGETHSASRYHAFQARRLNMRYRDAEGTVQFCHTLNNTVVASPRILIPLLELYQNEDGSVSVPGALRPYMGGMEKIAPTR